MITIILNPFGYDISVQPDFEVEKEQDYIESRIRIREMIHNGVDGAFVVVNERISNWYTSLCDYPDVQIQHKSPKSVLVRKLGCSESVRFDFPFREEEIIRLKLIERADSSRPEKKLQTSRDVELWVLSVILGKCWGEEKANVKHFIEISDWFLVLPEVPAELEGLKKQQQGIWCSSELGKLYQWLFSDPTKNAFLFYQHKILVNYPEILRNQLLKEGDIEEFPADLSKYLKQIPLIQPSQPNFEQADFSGLLERKWKSYLRSILQDGATRKHSTVPCQEFDNVIDTALKCMSSSIAGEANAILYFLRRHAEMVTGDMARRIEAKFGRFPSQVNQIMLLIPPKEPRDLDTRWNWEDVRDWLIGEYFPLSNWATRMEKQKDLLEGHTLRFGEWLYHAYPSLKNELSPLNYGTWYTIKDRISNRNKVLWLIIDNLRWYNTDKLISVFKDQNIFLCQEPEVKLSMLPSETRTSKSALVGGKLPSQLVSSDYAELFNLCCREHAIKSSRFIRDQELKDGKLDESQLTICMINRLDFSSHSGQFDLEDDIQDAIKRVARYVRAFIDRGEALTAHLRIIISTDHGSCMLPKSQKGVPKPKNSTEEQRFKRYIVVEGAPPVENDWFFLDKERFGLNENIAIVKGFKFVGSKRPTGLVHGGMTPEETVIPHMEFNLEPLEIGDLKLAYDGEPLPIGTKRHRIKLIVINPNNTAITDVIVNIPSHSIYLDIERILEQDSIEEQVDLSLPKETTNVDGNNNAHFQGNYGFTCRGQRIYGDIELQIVVRKIFDRSESAEKLFDL